MPLSNRLKNQHLLWRAAFGPMAENAASLNELSPNKLWETLLKTSAKRPEAINVASAIKEDQFKGTLDRQKISELVKERIKAIRRQEREDLKNLNIRWLDEMVNSEAQLREKMSLFWHGHFACRTVNILFQQALLDIIRTNALGRFSDLLREVSKSPAMLHFLNNQQNRKESPNENFAREVMELFTMGRGNYTEKDVKEAARAFTGWGFDLEGEFVFRKKQHDDGTKTFMGTTGNFNGDDIIQILLDQKQTARFITHKIFAYFVNERVEEKHVEWLSKRFYKSGYDIQQLMQDIFTSKWFYDAENIGTKIKSPVELLVGIRRLLPMELYAKDAQLLFQRALGQVLFYPPNVAGWPGGKNWIDSSTLLLRLRIPQIIAARESFTIRPKPDDDTMMGQMADEQPTTQKAKGYGVKDPIVIIDWEATEKIFKNVPRKNLMMEISLTILQTKVQLSELFLTKYLDNDSRQNYIKSAMIYLMSTPEYQLC